MDKDITPDEQPKHKVARRVLSEKRQYFVPEHSRSVEAKDVGDAVTKAKRANKGLKESADSAEEEGDE